MGKNKLLSIVAAVSVGAVIVGAGTLAKANAKDSKKQDKSINKVLLANKQGNENKAAVINGDGSLVLKESANKDSKSIAYLSVGEMLDIQEQSGDSYKVIVQETGATGYIATANVQKIVSEVNDKLVKKDYMASIINVSTNVHIRQNATMDSEILASLKNSMDVKVLGKQGSWYKINVGGKTGFVYDLYVAEKTNSNNPANKPNENAKPENSKIINGVVANSNAIDVGVYEDASSKTTLLGVLAPGAKVEVLGQDGNFYKINYKNGIGYIPVRYVNLTDSTEFNSSITGEAMVMKSNDGSNINIYRDASDKSTVVTSLAAGSKVNVLGREGNYYKVKLDDGKEGFILTRYITIGDDNNGVQAAVISNVVGNEEVNVYGDMSTDSTVLGKLKKGTELNLIQRKGEWYEIHFDNKTGYVQSKYVGFK